MIRILMIAAAASAVGGCADKGAAPAEDAVAQIVFAVAEIDGAAPASASTILFNGDGAVSGRGPCNSWGANYEIRGSSVDISNLFATKMACEPAIDAAETVFFDALGAVTRIETADGVLTLSDEKGARIKAIRTE